MKAQLGGWRFALLFKDLGKARQVSGDLDMALQITSGGRKTWLMTSPKPMPKPQPPS